MNQPLDSNSLNPSKGKSKSIEPHLTSSLDQDLDHISQDHTTIDFSDLEPHLTRSTTSLLAKPSHLPQIRQDPFHSSPIPFSHNHPSPLRNRRSRRSLKTRLRTEKARRAIEASQTVFFSASSSSASSPSPSPIRTLDHKPFPSYDQFSEVVTAVRLAILHPTKPLLPKLNLSGSSGSYFCKAHVDGNPEVVGIFKPKDEEPYGAMNPKWTKWLHRVFLAPLIGGFGRSCLIPNLSYLSEAAASLLDVRLEAYIVPRTEVVNISSPTFFYSWLDRQAATRKSKPRPLPQKPGSFQLFCTGFENASTVLRTHPWPGRPLGDTFDPHRRRRPRKTFSLYRLLCGQRSDATESDDESIGSDDDNDDDKLSNSTQPLDWYWTQELMDDFRHEMEKLVILDYLMRNTDRGLDNFMIKVCNANCHGRSRKVSATSMGTTSSRADISANGLCGRPHCHVAAIDNSLAFPHHHPNGWRDYSYGWLFLPVSLIGQPFSTQTRAHYLRLLTDPAWWAQTVFELRVLFGTDPDFNVAMFERQMAVLKGQGWNIVESLRHADEGPLELCRRKKALVWEEPMELSAQVLSAKTTSSDSALQTGPYPARGPMRIMSASQPTSPNLTTAMRPSSVRTLESFPRRPLRPVSLAVRRGSGADESEEIDGARGVDVIKHMDAMQAWEEDEEPGPPEPSGGQQYGTFEEVAEEENPPQQSIQNTLRSAMVVGFRERVEFVDAQPVFKNC